MYKKISGTARTLRYRYHKSLPPALYPWALARLYKRAIGQELNLKHPRTFTEKMQWVKLYDHNPLKTQLADKYLVREWIIDRIGEKYLIPLLGVWDSFDEIDFDLLPNQFVLKANHASGMNIIVTDKSRLDMYDAKEKFDKWLKINHAYISFELHYRNIVPKIIAEEYLRFNVNEPEDYKFICFDGEPKYCWIDVNRYTDHRRNVYDMNWRLQEWKVHNYKHTDHLVPKPLNFELMIELTKKLASGFSHVRVDWYNLQGRIYFGEMTFTSTSGFERIHPSKYDVLLGDMWKLPINK